MGEKINRKEFLKKFGILSLGSIFAMSKMGSMPAVKAAVSHNSDSEDISKDTIYTDSVSNVDVFTSGQSASDLAKAVNNISKSLHDETTERSSQFTSLSESFSKALAALKNTAVAKAIGVSGTTFPAVTAELSKIKDNKNWNKTITTPSKITIPAGYHDGNGFVDASSLKTPSGKKSITSNGTHDVTNYESVEVNVSAGSLGTFSTTDTVTKTVAGASSKKFYCTVSDLSFTDLGLYICDYAGCLVSVNAPRITVNGNNVSIVPAIVYVRFTSGTVFGLPGGVGARDSNRPDLTRAIPTTVYYQ